MNDIMKEYGADVDIHEAIEALGFAFMVNGLTPPVKIVVTKDTMERIKLGLLKKGMKAPVQAVNEPKPPNVVCQATASGVIQIVEE